MTDISKCDLDECPRKEHCYRYIAPSYMIAQSFLANPKEDCMDDDFAMQMPLNQPIVRNKKTMGKPRKD